MSIFKQTPITRVTDLDFSSHVPAPLNPNTPETVEAYEMPRNTPRTPIAVDIIRAMTPLSLAAIGCILGVAVLMSDNNTHENARTAGFGLASTAIAGAAGLAQTNNRQD